MRNKRAFTLAEVLITLMLVGIISAITIPLLLQEFNKNRWTITFKRTFAETFNALSRIALDEDCSKNLTCTHIFDNGQLESTKSFGNAMTKIMSTSRICGFENIAKASDSNPQDNPNSGCFSHFIKTGLSPQGAQNKYETLLTTMEGDVNFLTEQPFYTFVTNRGVSYAVFSFGMNCLNDSSYKELNDQYIAAYVRNDLNEGNQMLSLCGFVVVDVNGNQLPNIWGRDVFGVWITDRSVLGVYPFGGDDDKRFYSAEHCNNSDTRGCAADIIKNGWHMKY